MMRRPLLNKHMPALNLFWFTLKKNLPLMLLALAIMALVNPGLILSQISETLEHLSAGNTYDMSDVVIVVGISTTVTTTLMAMLLCLINFSYLYKKPASDVYHALPISRTKLLLSRFFASIVPALAPMLLSYVSLTCMGLIDRVEISVAEIWLHALTNLVILLMCAAFTMIFLVCAGNTFSFFASFIGVNISIPVIVYIGISLCDAYLYGFVEDPATVYNCTPVFYAFSQYRHIAGQGGWITILSHLPLMLLIAAVCLLVAVLLYNRRKSEKSGETYAFRFVYYIVSALLSFIGAFAVGYIFSEGEFDLAFWVFGLAGGILTAIAFGAISDKGFKTVKRSMILGGCAYVVMLLFTFGIILDLTGYEDQVPKAADVKSVSISDSRHSMNDLELTDATQAVALHRALLDTRDDDYGTYASTVTLKYHLKSGGTMTREYSVSRDDVYDEYVAVISSDQYRDAVIAEFAAIKQFGNWQQNYSLDVYLYDTNTGEDVSYSPAMSAEQVNEFLTLYFKELPLTHTSSLAGNYDGTQVNVNLCGVGIKETRDSHQEYRSVYMNLIVSPEMTGVSDYIETLIVRSEAAEQ